MVLFRYFWLLCFVVMMVNVLIWRRRMLTLASQGDLDTADAAAFTRYSALGFGGLCGVLLVLQSAAGWESPLCIYALPFTEPWALSTWGVYLVAWAILLAWVWFGQGAELISRISPALSKRFPGRRYTPSQVRLGITVLIVCSGVGGYFAGRSRPPIVDPMCTSVHSEV